MCAALNRGVATLLTSVSVDKVRQTGDTAV